MTANPRRALEINTEASLEFLCSVMPEKHVQIIGRSIGPTDENILEMDILEEVPDLHRPESRFLAQKLGHVDAFRDRILPKVQRKMKRASKPNAVPRSNEIWMHVISTTEEVRQYRESKFGAKEAQSAGQSTESVIKPGEEQRLGFGSGFASTPHATKQA